jgi:hypothetical protein
MKAIIFKKTGEWADLNEQGWWTGNIPKLFPDTSSLEALITYYEKHGLDLSKEDFGPEDYKMVKVDLKIIGE